MMNRIEQETLRAALEMAKDRREAAEAATTSPSVRLIGGPLDEVRQNALKHPVPHEWREALERIAPFSLNTNWLTLRWFAKAERWVIDECVPERCISPAKRDQLSGTPYWKMPKMLQAGRRQMVSAYQWEMFRKHRVWARPFWCLQGTDGGTPARYTDLEEAILKAEGHTTDVPQPGALPYASWDNRVAYQVRLRDALGKLVREGDASALAEAEKAGRIKFLAWWTETMQPQVDFLNSQAGRREADSVLRPATDGEKLAAELLEESYIERGVVPHAADTPLSLV